MLAVRAGGTASLGLVAPSPRLLYSGMMPGWLAAQYAFDDCAIDLAAVCARSGIDWIQDRIVDIDFAAREAIGVNASYPFDLASINVGSDNGLGVLDADVRAGGGPVVIGAKPFAEFVDRWNAWLAACKAAPAPRALLVAGGGAAAVEIAFALAALARSRGALMGSRVTIASSGDRLLPGMSSLSARSARRSLEDQGVELRFGPSYAGAGGGFARFDGGPPIAVDLVVVATGARPPAWLQAAALRDSVTLAPDGGLAVRSDLRSTSHPAVFAAGDCAGFVDQRVPRSGVHALRQGPVLAENLASALAQVPVSAARSEALPARYAARRWTLALLNRCDGSAIGNWGPLGFSGRWAWRWKDRIDQRFIARFRGMRSTGTAIDVVAIVPALNEERAIAACIAPLLAEGARVLVVDGGSRDATVAVARASGARVLEAGRGRASQMNAGAAAESDAGLLVFVHADSVLPAGWRSEVERALASGRRWGRFDVRLGSDRPLLRLVGAMMNLRSRLTGICTGDQAIFVLREAWQRSGGYPSIPLMEDIELSRRLRDAEGPPAALRSRVEVSARRWESRGVLRTIAQMWLLRAMYFFGASAERLHRIYYGRSR